MADVLKTPRAVTGLNHVLSEEEVEAAEEDGICDCHPGNIAAGIDAPCPLHRLVISHRALASQLKAITEERDGLRDQVGNLHHHLCDVENHAAKYGGSDD